MHATITRLKDSRASLVGEMQAIVNRATEHDRDFTVLENERLARIDGEIGELDERVRQVDAGEQREADAAATWKAHQARPVVRGGAGVQIRTNPLAITSQALDALQNAIDSRSVGRFVAADEEQRAALATTTYGAPRAWGSNVLGGPRLLHVAAGVPRQDTDAVLAQHPNLTLPTASASVGENVALAEFAASTAGSVTLARFGRWTDMSRESGFGTDAGAIIGMHQIGVALDLDKVLIDAVEAAAGAAVAFTADVPAAIRKAIALVISATAAADSADLVCLVHPDNAALLQDVTPIGGQTIAEGFQRFSGSLVYPSTAVNTGFVTVANLRAGARFFEAQGFLTETEVAVKTGTVTAASSVIAGYGVGLTGGFASMVDVVTP